MLAEGFLRSQQYREDRGFASASKRHQTQTHTHCTEPFKSTPSNSDSTELQTDSAEAGSNQDKLDSNLGQVLRVLPQGPVGLSIPESSPALALGPDFRVCIDDCSLLEQYPDLHVVDSGLISYTPLGAAINQHGVYTPVSGVARPPGQGAQWEPQGGPVSALPDQGYLVRGSSATMSLLCLPGSGLEPMSNSLLNGLLDKQLEEVYMQHLTDNLARCNSHLGNSLLRGLVPPPQPSSRPQGPDSLEASLEEGSGGGTGKKISYPSTQNLFPCSSNFSSPVLRISETDNYHLKKEFLQ